MSNYYVSYYNLSPGDRIVIPKSNLRIVQHHTIYLGYDNNGTHWIIENVIGTGVRLITVDDFFRGVTSVTRIEKFQGTNVDRKLAVQNALLKVGKPYDLINYNCESFANEVQKGTITSSQVKAGI